MKHQKIILMLGAIFVTLAIVWLAQAQKTTEGNFETKISESRLDGEYVRTTEVFRDKVLVSKKQECSSHDNGNIDFIFTKLFRDGEMIYMSSFYKSDHCTIRDYYHQGKLVVQEGDKDGDGFFERMILFDAKEQPVEAFERKKDGTVTQLNEEEFSKLKKAFSMIAEPK